MYASLIESSTCTLSQSLGENEESAVFASPSTFTLYTPTEFGAWEAVEDTIEGFKELGKWGNVGNTALHLIDTLSIMYNALSDSFINDVINGEVMLLHKLVLDS